MSDNRTVSGHVEVEQDNRASVAYKLMDRIASAEYKTVVEEQKGRAYWLTLYRQCYKAANGSGLESILKKE